MKDMEEMETSLPKLRDNILAAWQNGQSELDTEQVEALKDWRWEKAKHFLVFNFTFSTFTFCFVSLSLVRLEVGEGQLLFFHFHFLFVLTLPF